MEDNESVVGQESQSDVSQETSSESQTTSEPVAQEATPAQKETPFHEHPRWKEVMAERDSERQARAQMEQQLREMQRQLQEASRPKENKPDFNEVRTKMAERLKGIDPEFQSYMSLLEEQALSAKQELQAFREQQFVERAVGRISELNKTNGVSSEIASLYEAALDKAYREGKIRSMEDVEKTYKAIHEPFAKTLAEREKAALDKYVAEKKTAATKPAPQPKGRVANQSQTPQRFANDQQRKASIVKEIVADLRAGRDLG